MLLNIYFCVMAIAWTVTGQMSPNTSSDTGKLGNATVIVNNPPGQTYVATLHGDAKDNNIKGSIYAVADSNGIGVQFMVNLTNLPKEGGPFAYHIHEEPVPSDGNCSATKGHLDPFERGDAPPCNSALPQTCQVGDLSGKHGSISTDPFSAAYSDDFASTCTGSSSFFGNRSITFHYNNKTRIACANFLLVESIMLNNTNPNNITPDNTNTTSPMPFIGSASHVEAAFISIIVLFFLQLTLLVDPIRFAPTFNEK